MFKSPEALRKYALAVSSQLRNEGLIEHSIILEHCAKLPCTTGWEWLGELELGVEEIINLGPLSEDIEEKLDTILKSTKSTTPYG